MADNDVRYIDQNVSPLTFGPRVKDLGGGIRETVVGISDSGGSLMDPSSAQLQGAITETAPATDTASSGQNGRLQRIAQRISSLIALFPTSLGQKASTASLPVVLSSDQSAIPSSQSGTWTVQPGNTANTTAWKVDGSAVTQPTSSVTEGAITDTAWSGAGNSTTTAALKAIYGKVAAVLGVSQSGTWTVQPGNTANTTAWKVDGSAVTQPVSGTVSSNATQSGTWTVQPGNTANTTAWKVDGSAVTQPISQDGSGSIATAQVSVTTSSTQIVAVRSGRQAVTIINHGTTDTYLGVSGLTTSTGILLPGVAGASQTIPTTAAVFGRVGSGTQTVSVLETF